MRCRGFTDCLTPVLPRPDAIFSRWGELPPLYKNTPSVVGINHTLNKSLSVGIHYTLNRVTRVTIYLGPAALPQDHWEASRASDALKQPRALAPIPTPGPYAVKCAACSAARMDGRYRVERSLSIGVGRDLGHAWPAGTPPYYRRESSVRHLMVCDVDHRIL